MTGEMSGRVCLVTGATSGHGLAVAKALADRGAELIIHGRDEQKTRAVARELGQRQGARPEVMLCDLTSRDEIDEACAKLLARGRPLHVLVNNAGAVFRERALSEHGVEMTLAVNALAPFQLTNRLAKRLIESAPARVVNVASEAHVIGDLNLADLEHRRWFNVMTAYGRSKLAVIIWTLELARRLEGTGVTVNCVDPGPVQSNIGQNNPGLTAELLKVVMRRFFPTAERAARTTIYLATAAPLASVTGKYYRFMAEREPTLKRAPVNAGQRFWDVAARLTKADLEL
jgi:retinol dehydrogenase 12